MARRALGPATLAAVQAVAAALKDDDRQLIVACSGGPDSLALAGATLPVARRQGLGCAAVVVDHGLQTGSAEIAARARDQLAALGYADVTVAPVLVERRSGGPEAAAREARYTALSEAAAQRGACVLLGHTLDDQAETVLLGLARGSGTRSLAGMAARNGPFVRPFLTLRRSATAQVCRELGVLSWQDPHNDDPRFARVRVRRRVLPSLEADLGPGIAEALARTAALARDDADVLDALAGETLLKVVSDQQFTVVSDQPLKVVSDQPLKVVSDQPLKVVSDQPLKVVSDQPLKVVSDQDDSTGRWSLDCAALAEHPAAVRRRVIRLWLAALGAHDLTMEHLAAADRLISAWRGQRRVDLPGVSVGRVAGRLTVL